MRYSNIAARPGRTLAACTPVEHVWREPLRKHLVDDCPIEQRFAGMLGGNILVGDPHR